MSDSNSVSSSGCGVGSIGFGSIIAMILSWSVNHSVIWLIIHGFFSWFYVFYYLIFK